MLITCYTLIQVLVSLSSLLSHRYKQHTVASKQHPLINGSSGSGSSAANNLSLCDRFTFSRVMRQEKLFCPDSHIIEIQRIKRRSVGTQTLLKAALTVKRLLLIKTESTRSWEQTGSCAELQKHNQTSGINRRHIHFPLYLMTVS